MASVVQIPHIEHSSWDVVTMDLINKGLEYDIENRDAFDENNKDLFKYTLSDPSESHQYTLPNGSIRGKPAPENPKSAVSAERDDRDDSDHGGGRSGVSGNSGGGSRGKNREEPSEEEKTEEVKPGKETPAPETPAPETPASETSAPETSAPETPASEETVPADPAEPTAAVMPETAAGREEPIELPRIPLT